MNFASLIIITAVLMVTLTNGILVAKSALSKTSNLEFLSTFYSPCTPIPTKLSNRMVVLRIDDIQAFGWEDISERMINDALKEAVPVVLGVIPHDLAWPNPMYQYLKKINCSVEIAQHGWLHQGEHVEETPEFQNLNESEAEQKILSGKKILSGITNHPLIAFIPSENVYSTGTALALRKNGFLVLSSQGKRHFDYTAATYDFQKHAPVSVPDIVKKCDEHFKKSDVCVVMLHPQDYSTNGKLDADKYRAFGDLIAAFRQQNLTFVRFRDILSGQKP